MMVQFSEPSLEQLPEKYYLISGSCILLAWKIFEDRWPQRTRMKSHLIGDSIFRRFKPDLESSTASSSTREKSQQPSTTAVPNDQSARDRVEGESDSTIQSVSLKLSNNIVNQTEEINQKEQETCSVGEDIQKTPVESVNKDTIAENSITNTATEENTSKKSELMTDKKLSVSVRWEMIDAYLLQCTETGNMAVDIMNEYLDGAREGQWSAEKIKKVIIMKYTQYLLVLERRLCELLSYDIFALKRQPSIQFDFNGNKKRIESSHDWGVLSYIEDGVKLMIKHQDDKRKLYQLNNNSSNVIKSSEITEEPLSREDNQIIDELIERLMILPSTDHNLFKLSSIIALGLFCSKSVMDFNDLEIGHCVVLWVKLFLTADAPFRQTINIEDYYPANAFSNWDIFLRCFNNITTIFETVVVYDLGDVEEQKDSRK